MSSYQDYIRRLEVVEKDLDAIACGRATPPDADFPLTLLSDTDTDTDLWPLFYRAGDIFHQPPFYDSEGRKDPSEPDQDSRERAKQFSSFVARVLSRWRGTKAADYPYSQIAAAALVLVQLARGGLQSQRMFPPCMRLGESEEAVGTSLMPAGGYSAEERPILPYDEIIQIMCNRLSANGEKGHVPTPLGTQSSLYVREDEKDTDVEDGEWPSSQTSVATEIYDQEEDEFSLSQNSVRGIRRLNSVRGPSEPKNEYPDSDPSVLPTGLRRHVTIPTLFILGKHDPVLGTTDTDLARWKSDGTNLVQAIKLHCLPSEAFLCPMRTFVSSLIYANVLYDKTRGKIDLESEMKECQWAVISELPEHDLVAYMLTLMTYLPERSQTFPPVF